MVRVNEIKKNPRCIASITIRAKKAKSVMQVGSKTHKILGILHQSQKTGKV